MLVAAVSIMGAGLMAWSNMSFATQQREIADKTNSRINLIAESFIIESVWFYADPDPPNDKYADVTIRNTGELAIKISKVYINNAQVWSGSHDILAGEVDEVQVPYEWQDGDSQSIWVVTERGGEIKQIWKS